jgi:NADH-quinone oxidoreductase subunit E
VNDLLNKYPEEIQTILSRYPAEQKRSAVMPLLFLAQRDTPYVTRQAIQEIAHILEISTTDVASIVGFYTLFHEEPGGRYRIQICTDLPCALRGAEEFLNEVSGYLGIGVGETTPDGLFTIEEVKCLAACHRAPMFQVQGDGEIVYHEHQTLETARAIFDELKQKVHPTEEEQAS